jgi:hypothetical protein
MPTSSADRRFAASIEEKRIPAGTAQWIRIGSRRKIAAVKKETGELKGVFVSMVLNTEANPEFPNDSPLIVLILYPFALISFLRLLPKIGGHPCHH